jgi:hypothetical protein
LTVLYSFPSRIPLGNTLKYLWQTMLILKFISSIYSHSINVIFYEYIGLYHKEMTEVFSTCYNCSGGSVFRSLPEDWLSSFRIFIVLLSPSKQIQEWFLRQGHNRFLPYVPSHPSSIILSLDAMYSEILTVLLYSP